MQNTSRRLPLFILAATVTICCPLDETLCSACYKCIVYIPFRILTGTPLDCDGDGTAEAWEEIFFDEAHSECVSSRFYENACTRSRTTRWTRTIWFYKCENGELKFDYEGTSRDWCAFGELSCI